MAHHLSGSLFDARALDELVEGNTNVPLALHDGRLSSEVLERAVAEYELLLSRSLYPYVSVVRVDTSGQKMDMFSISPVLHYYPRPMSCVRRTFFYKTGQLISEEALRLGMLRGIFSPSLRKRTEDKLDEILGAARQARQGNLAEVKQVTGSVQVYLGNAETVKRQAGKEANFIPLPGPEQFIEHSKRPVLQVATYLLGGNALIDYQRASPARGTPVLLQ